MIESYAIIRTTDAVVLNIILWDGTTPYAPPSGTRTVRITSACDLGWVYDAQTHTFSPPTP